MSFIVTKKTDYIPAPVGTFPSVVCDVEDLGQVSGHYGSYHACRISFQLDEEVREGQRFVVGRRYPVSLGSRSALRELLTTLLGADFDGESADLENLIGLPCLVAIQQSQGDNGNVYANVASVTRLPRGMKPIVVEGYTRHKDRGPKLVSQPRHQMATAEKFKPATEVREKDGITDDDMLTPVKPADAREKDGITDDEEADAPETNGMTDDDGPF